VAEPVVDVLEVVEIDHHEAAGLAGPSGAGHFDLELDGEEPLVVEAGEIVAEAERFELPVLAGKLGEPGGQIVCGVDDEVGRAGKKFPVFRRKPLGQDDESLRACALPGAEPGLDRHGSPRGRKPGCGGLLIQKLLILCSFLILESLAWSPGGVIAGMARQSRRIALSPMPLCNDRFSTKVCKKGACAKHRVGGPGQE
jgi:hypothetical protein